MAHTTEDMKREARAWIIEHYLDQLEPEERLKGLDPEDRLNGLDPAFIEAWLAKQRKDFPGRVSRCSGEFAAFKRRSGCFGVIA